MLLKDGAGCGEFMGQDNLERLSNCNQDVSAHLRRYHLSKESLSEYDLILLRAEFLNVATSQLENMLVCSRHRGNLGVHWRGRTANILNIKAHKKELNVTEHSHGNWLRK